MRRLLNRLWSRCIGTCCPCAIGTRLPGKLGWYGNSYGGRVCELIEILLGN